MPQAVTYQVFGSGSGPTGLGTMAIQNANAVAITGGSIAGVTDLAVTDGGTGASNAANARTNLGVELDTDVPSESSFLSLDLTVSNHSTDLITLFDRIEALDTGTLGVLTSDVDIYVATTGDDETGDGLISNPYATVQKAIQVASVYALGTRYIQIHVAEGIYSTSSPITAGFLTGAGIYFYGDTDSDSNVAFSDFDIAASTDGAFPRLQYFDCTVTLNSGTAVVGQFVVVKSVSGGTNSEAVLGCHEIINVEESELTLRIWQCLNVPELPSGNIVGNIEVMRTVIKSSASVVVNILSSTNGGTWNGFVFQGDGTFASAYGVRAIGPAVFRIEGICAVTGVRYGLHFSRRSLFDASGTAIVAISKIYDFGVVADIGGFVYGGSHALVSGVGGTYAVESINNAHITILTGSVVASGTLAAVYCDRNSYVDARSGLIAFDDSAGTAFYADNGAFIHANSATVIGYSATKYPATNPGTNGAYVIGL